MMCSVVWYGTCYAVSVIQYLFTSFGTVSTFRGLELLAVVGLQHSGFVSV